MKRSNALFLPALLTVLLGGCAADTTGGTSAGLCATAGDGSDEVVFVASQIGFAPVEDGVTDAFDVDGIVSEDGDPESCGHEDFVTPDGRGGADNGFAALVRLIERIANDAVDGLVQMAINVGDLLVVIKVTGVDDMQNDDCVNVTILEGEGFPELGTDGLILPSQTFDVAADSPVSTGSGRIVDGRLTVDPFEAIIPITIFQIFFDLRVHNAQIRLDIDPETGYGTGAMGGGIENDQILEVGEESASMDSNAAEIFAVAPIVLGANADLAPESERTCNQISASLLVEARPAFIYEDAQIPEPAE